MNPHEPIKDTGLRRTYPNWVAREGARGMEYNAWGSPPNPPEHEANLVFTRMLAGPMDFTPGVLSLKGRGGQPIQSTIAKQLALYVVIYSPIQMAADLPENYAKHLQAFQFIKDVPTDWADTRVLNGEVGDFVTIARKDRNSEDWYLGSVSDESARDAHRQARLSRSGTQLHRADLSRRRRCGLEDEAARDRDRETQGRTRRRADAAAGAGRRTGDPICRGSKAVKRQSVRQPRRTDSEEGRGSASGYPLVTIHFVDVGGASDEHLQEHSSRASCRTGDRKARDDVESRDSAWRPRPPRRKTRQRRPALARRRRASKPSSSPASGRGIEDAIELKRDSSSIVEAISAEDIGKLPDTSIAESISRLPGLTSQRAEGRASAISLRGTDPGFTTALLNGREQVSTGDNRSIEFEQYPSELLSAVVVYKTPDAQLVGPGSRRHDRPAHDASARVRPAVRWCSTSAAK